MHVDFASTELQLLYTDNVGADTYTAETVKLFRRRVRQIEAANSMRDVQSLRCARYKQIGIATPLKASLALNGPWSLIITEEDRAGIQTMVITEIAELAGSE